MDDISCHAPADLRMARVAEKTKMPAVLHGGHSVTRPESGRTDTESTCCRLSVFGCWLSAGCFMLPRIRPCPMVANGGKLTKNRGRAPETEFLDPTRTLFIRRARNTRNEWRYNSRPFQASAGYQRIIDIRQAGASGRHTYGAR